MKFLNWENRHPITKGICWELLFLLALVGVITVMTLFLLFLEYPFLAILTFIIYSLSIYLINKGVARRHARKKKRTK